MFPDAPFCFTYSKLRICTPKRIRIIEDNRQCRQTGWERQQLNFLTSTSKYQQTGGQHLLLQFKNVTYQVLHCKILSYIHFKPELHQTRIPHIFVPFLLLHYQLLLICFFSFKARGFCKGNRPFHSCMLSYLALG